VKRFYRADGNYRPRPRVPPQQSGGLLCQTKHEDGALAIMALASIPTIHDPALAELVTSLVDAYHPARVYVFGSVARGEACPDSDYDLMVVMPDNAAPELLRSRIGYRASRSLGVARGILVMKSSDFDRQLHLRASLPSTVVREGRLLYEC